MQMFKTSEGLPIFFTDDFFVIEGPTIWVSQVSKRRSRSRDTLRNYSCQLGNFLQWLDDEGYGAPNWQQVDRPIVESYVEHEIRSRDPSGRPRDKSIEQYVATIANFYKWARASNYDHYWEMKLETVTVVLKNAAINEMRRSVQKREISLGGSDIDAVSRARRAIVDNKSFFQWLGVLKDDDLVYSLIAIVIRMTALRASEVLQLPFQGVGLNAALRPYDEKELESLLDLPFEFKSKGKHREIYFPGILWKEIVSMWMPERSKRAERYKERYGVNPPPDVLFLSERGDPVTYKMLYTHFAKAGRDKKSPRTGITAVTLRRTWATYFVIRSLKATGRLKRGYVHDEVLAHVLRTQMGHVDIETTYKHYVLLANSFDGDDLIYDLNDAENKDLLRKAGFRV